MTEPRSEHLDPESLVARMIAELQANPDAQRLLLRALLTNEFLGMPARLDHIEQDIAELKGDVAQLKNDMTEVKADLTEVKADVAELKNDVAHLKNNVGSLRGSDLEMRVHRKIRPLLSQHLQLQRARIMQSTLQQGDPEFVDTVSDAADSGRISVDQELRITATDVILHARRKGERTPVWIAVEVAGRVDADDIRRSRESAAALGAVFGEAAVAAVVGYRIDQADRTRADAAGVSCLEVPEPA